MAKKIEVAVFSLTNARERAQKMIADLQAKIASDGVVWALESLGQEAMKAEKFLQHSFDPAEFQQYLSQKGAKVVWDDLTKTRSRLTDMLVENDWYKPNSTSAMSNLTNIADWQARQQWHGYLSSLVEALEGELD